MALTIINRLMIDGGNNSAVVFGNYKPVHQNICAAPYQASNVQWQWGYNGNYILGTTGYSNFTPTIYDYTGKIIATAPPYNNGLNAYATPFLQISSDMYVFVYGNANYYDVLYAFKPSTNTIGSAQTFIAMPGSSGGSAPRTLLYANGVLFVNGQNTSGGMDVQAAININANTGVLGAGIATATSFAVTGIVFNGTNYYIVATNTYESNLFEVTPANLSAFINGNGNTGYVRKLANVWADYSADMTINGNILRISCKDIPASINISAWAAISGGAPWASTNNAATVPLIAQTTNNRIYVQHERVSISLATDKPVSQTYVYFSKVRNDGTVYSKRFEAINADKLNGYVVDQYKKLEQINGRWILTVGSYYTNGLPVSGAYSQSSYKYKLDTADITEVIAEIDNA